MWWPTGGTIRTRPRRGAALDILKSAGYGAIFPGIVEVYAYLIIPEIHGLYEGFYKLRLVFFAFGAPIAHLFQHIHYLFSVYGLMCGLMYGYLFFKGGYVRLYLQEPIFRRGRENALLYRVHDVFRRPASVRKGVLHAGQLAFSDLSGRQRRCLLSTLW